MSRHKKTDFVNIELVDLKECGDDLNSFLIKQDLLKKRHGKERKNRDRKLEHPDNYK